MARAKATKAIKAIVPQLPPSHLRVLGEAGFTIHTYRDHRHTGAI